MNSALTILDYSIHGNAIDSESDRRIAEAAAVEGVDAVIHRIEPDDTIRCDTDRVWLRYDLRSRHELSWIVGVAQDLDRRGHRVFPRAESIRLAGDKWETFHELRRAGIPTLETRLAFNPLPFGLPVIVKPRVGWGSIGNRILRPGCDPIENFPAEEMICQPFIEHHRTWIVPVAGDCELAAIEACREPERDGELRMADLPAGGAGLGTAAADALGLQAATVDLIETRSGIMVLEVNSAPRLAYPDLTIAEPVGPMVRAVLAWMKDSSIRPVESEIIRKPEE